MADFVVSGQAHASEKAQRLASRLSKGSKVTLVPDPENQYDSQAIKVLVNEHQIGWVNQGCDRKHVIFKRLMKGGSNIGTVDFNEMIKGDGGKLIRSIGITTEV